MRLTCVTEKALRSSREGTHARVLRTNRRVPMSSEGEAPRRSPRLGASTPAEVGPNKKKRPFEPTEPGQAWKGHAVDEGVKATVEYDREGKKQKASEKFKDVQVCFRFARQHDGGPTCMMSLSVLALI